MVLIWDRVAGGGKREEEGSSGGGRQFLERVRPRLKRQWKRAGSGHKEALVSGSDWLRRGPKAVWERDPLYKKLVNDCSLHTLFFG